MATSFVGQFKIYNHCVIGKGVSAEVKLAEDTISGRRCAVKVIYKNKLTPSGTQNLITEIKALRLIRHSNVVQLLATHEERDKFYIFMEYLSNGTLYNHISKKGRLTEDEARALMLQLVDALEHCHKNNVYHRDLKLENFVFGPDNSIKIIDFGLSAVVESANTLLSQYCGTHLYASPQIHAGTPYTGEGADIWSLGINFYILLCGYMPFYSETNNAKELAQRVRFSAPLPMVAGLSWQVVDLVNRMLTKDPAHRITLSELKKHPWMTAGTAFSAGHIEPTPVIMNTPVVMQTVN